MRRYDRVYLLVVIRNHFGAFSVFATWTWRIWLTDTLRCPFLPSRSFCKFASLPEGLHHGLRPGYREITWILPALHASRFGKGLNEIHAGWNNFHVSNSVPFPYTSYAPLILIYLISLALGWPLTASSSLKIRLHIQWGSELLAQWNPIHILWCNTVDMQPVNFIIMKSLTSHASRVRIELFLLANCMRFHA